MICSLIKTLLIDIKTNTTSFCKALSDGDLDLAKELKKELEEKRNELQKLLWPFKELPQKELKEQYESQKQIFKQAGILEKLSNGELGIKAINNKEYTFPTYNEIAKMARENKEALKVKIGQGFTELLIIPFGMSLDDLIAKYKQIILKHHKEGKLLATKEKPTDPDELLKLNESKPVWVWDKYREADIKGELVYYPKEFSSNHQGQTKQEILQEQGGFNMLFIENMPNIPRTKQLPKGDRIPIDTKGTSIKEYIKKGETIPSPNEYLKAITNKSMYNHETSMTPEDQIIYAILYLGKTNQVIDDYQGKGSISYQLGSYFVSDGNVPYACWHRDDRQAFLGRSALENRNENCGVRPAVRLRKKIMAG